MTPTKTGLYTTNADGRSILLYWDGKDWVNADGLRPRFKTVQWSRGPWFVPALRTWRGLDAEDLAQIDTDEFWQVGNHMAIAMAVEDKLKEKNSG
jgi:hypothetical protein